MLDYCGISHTLKYFHEVITNQLAQPLCNAIMSTKSTLCGTANLLVHHITQVFKGLVAGSSVALTQMLATSRATTPSFLSHAQFLKIIGLYILCVAIPILLVTNLFEYLVGRSAHESNTNVASELPIGAVPPTVHRIHPAELFKTSEQCAQQIVSAKVTRSSVDPVPIAFEEYLDVQETWHPTSAASDLSGDILSHTQPSTESSQVYSECASLFDEHVRRGASEQEHPRVGTELTHSPRQTHSIADRHQLDANSENSQSFSSQSDLIDPMNNLSHWDHHANTLDSLHHSSQDVFPYIGTCTPRANLYNDNTSDNNHHQNYQLENNYSDNNIAAYQALRRSVADPQVLVGWLIALPGINNGTTGVVLDTHKRPFHSTRFTVELQNGQVRQLALQRSGRKGIVPFVLLEKMES